MECTVSLKNPESGRVYFIEPEKFGLLDWQMRNRMNETPKLCGCRWTGVTRAALTPENDYTATFKFNALQYGIFEVQSFYIAENQGMAKAVRVPMLSHVFVSPNSMLI